LYNFDLLLCALYASHRSAMYVLIPGRRKCTENFRVCKTKFSQTLQVLIILDLFSRHKILAENLNVTFSNRLCLTDYIVGTYTHSQLACHTSHFGPFQGLTQHTSPLAIRCPFQGSARWSRIITDQFILTSHRSAYFDQSQIQELGKEIVRRCAAPNCLYVRETGLVLTGT